MISANIYSFKSKLTTRPPEGDGLNISQSWIIPPHHSELNLIGLRLYAQGIVREISSTFLVGGVKNSS